MTLRTFRAWLRMGVTLLVLLAIVLVVFMNRNNVANVWLFHDFKQIPVLWLIVITAIFSLVAKWVVGGVYHAYKQLKTSQEKDALNNILNKDKATS